MPKLSDADIQEPTTPPAHVKISKSGRPSTDTVELIKSQLTPQVDALGLKLPLRLCGGFFLDNDGHYIGEREREIIIEIVNAHASQCAEIVALRKIRDAAQRVVLDYGIWKGDSSMDTLDEVVAAYDKEFPQ